MAMSNQDAKETDEFRFSSDMTLEDIRACHRDFCRERNWGQFHTPRNILLAMVGEVGELSEIFQWKGEVKTGLPEFSEEEKKHVGEEISDIMIYLVDLAAQCHIDLPAALHAKLQLNAKKYPVNVANGSSQKFSIYGEDRNVVGTSVPEREREEGDGSE
ncbi:UNVERIFIED_CONTAM: hypothetical protein GTU68_005907 [Idotea baltica]|nr:hypothetical protein [Idotea baltica]